MNPKAEKLMRKSRLGYAYAHIEDARVREMIADRLAELLAETRVTDKMLLKHLKGAILPSVAMYAVLQDNGVPGEEAYRRIRVSAMKSCEGFTKTLNRAAKIPFFYPIFKALLAMTTKKVFGPAGWDFRWKQNDRERVAWDCHRCFYLDQFTAYGMAELTPIFCEVDDACYGNIPGIGWGRTKTLAKGADVCDFCFINEKHLRK